MKQIKINVLTVITILFVASVFFASCSVETLDKKSVVKVADESKMSDFDKFLKREFVDPYNIEVSYKLDDVDTNLGYNVTPASEEKAIQMANLIKYICLDAFAKHTDANFLKENFPKEIVLIGSGAYNNNGTVLLGTAEGGVKIVLYDINNLDPTNAARLVDRYFNTIFHEFAHILHQKKRYTADYEKISQSKYVGDSWSNYWNDTKTNTPPSYTEGFISNYSSKEPNEDFVEMFSHHVTLTQAQFKNRIDPNNDNAEGVSKIDKKVKIVRSYMKDSWNMSIDDMKDEVLYRLDNLSNIDLNNID